MNRFICGYLFLFSSLTLMSQNTSNKALNLLNNRLKAIEEEKSRLKNENAKLLAEIETIRRNEAYDKPTGIEVPRRNEAYDKRTEKEKDKQLQIALTDLMNNRIALNSKLLETESLRDQISILQHDSTSLSRQVQELEKTRAELSTELDNTKLKLVSLNNYYSEELSRARKKSVEENLKYPFGRPTPKKIQYTTYIDFPYSIGEKLTWESRRTQWGIGAGFNTFRSVGSNFERLNYASLFAHLKQYGRFPENLFKSERINHFFNFELGYPQTINYSRANDYPKGIVYTNLGFGVSILLDKNRYFSSSFGFKILHGTRNLNGLKSSVVYYPGYFRIEFTL